MKTLAATTRPARLSPATDARLAWRRRVARIGSLIQLGFAALWLGRGTLATGWPARLPVALALAAAAVAIGVWGETTTRGWRHGQPARPPDRWNGRSPSPRSRNWRLAPSFGRDRPEFTYGMGAGAALMAAWTLLLLWADRRPLQRKDVLPLTMVVIAGLLANDERARRAGLTSSPALAPTRVLQLGLLALFGASYGLARRSQQ